MQGENMDKNNITKATLGRLPMYLKYLESISEEDNPYISSPKITRALGLGAVQVRKDLSCVSQTGKAIIKTTLRIYSTSGRPQQMACG